MRTVPDRESSGDPGAPDGAANAFVQGIEERYAEWEKEFGADVDERRTTAFDPKQGSISDSR
jgi:hypothetical protein